MKESNAVDMIATARSAQESAERGVRRKPGMMKLIAPAKVNLFLAVGQRRPDGYHEVTTVMHGLSLHDVLYMGFARPESGAAEEGLKIALSCHSFEGLPELDVCTDDNIVVRAVRLLAARIGRAETETIDIVLEKHIPAEAGLGGGSSDAAAALLGAARLWGLPADDERIEQTARELGADVAFFLHGGCACFEGVGEAFLHALTPSTQSILLVKPAGGVSTAQAYRLFDEDPRFVDAEAIADALDATDASAVPLRNNLVDVSEACLPALADIRRWLSGQEGVEDALMSGSGSAVFARCADFTAACRLAGKARSQGWWARTTTLSAASAAIVSA